MSTEKSININMNDGKTLTIIILSLLLAIAIGIIIWIEFGREPDGKNQEKIQQLEIQKTRLKSEIKDLKDDIKFYIKEDNKSDSIISILEDSKVTIPQLEDKANRDYEKQINYIINLDSTGRLDLWTRKTRGYGW